MLSKMKTFLEHLVYMIFESNSNFQEQILLTQFSCFFIIPGASVGGRE